jgi:zinc transporter
MNKTIDWTHLDFSDPESATWVEQESGLDDMITGALLEQESRPRSVQYENGVMVILRGVNLNPGEQVEDMISIRLWLEKDRVISTSRRRLESVEGIRKEFESGQGPATPGEFLTLLVQNLSDRINDSIEQIEKSLEYVEENLDERVTLSRNSPFSVLRRQSARIRRYLAPQREALDRLSRIADSVFSADDLANFREHANRLTLILEDLDLVRERTMVAQEEFLGILAHQQNERMLLLSIVAAIFLPLSFLTGLMGMNVAGLPGLENEAAFWILVIMMLAVAGAIMALFRYKKWY